MSIITTSTDVAGPATNGADPNTSVANAVIDSTAPSMAEAPSAGADDGEVQVEDGHELESVAVMTESLAVEELAPSLDGLRPIGEASFGLTVGAETVHQPDDRVQITNTGDYPWRVHASLLITARDGSKWLGTGWFIGPHTLITAGHVVYIKNSGVPGRDGWVQSIQVMPGRNGNTMPYGTVVSTNFRTVVGWATNGDPEYDYGAIILSTDLGSRTGWFGFATYTDADLSGATVNVSGYPGDKPAGTQWYHWNKVASVSTRKVYYDIDTYGGQSGSAVYRIVNGARYGVAVHAYGGAVTNSGTRITRPVFDNLLAWKA